MCTMDDFGFDDHGTPDSGLGDLGDNTADSGCDLSTDQSMEMLEAMDIERETSSASNTSTSKSGSKGIKRRTDSGNLKKTPTGLPHYPDAPPTYGTGPTGDPLAFMNDHPSHSHTVANIHTDFANDFGELFDDDDLE